MTPEQRKMIKAKLVEDLSALDKEIEELQEFVKPITPECAIDDVARTDLMNDQEISIRTLHDAQIRRNKLEYALRKVDKEEYGLCLECEDEIPFERLIILPEATHCIECASRL
jgi:DnaK suppressor protein